MKKLGLLIALLASSQAWASWTLVHSAVINNTGACTSGAASCAIPVTSTAAGNVIVIGILSGASVTINSVSGGGAYTHCSNCAGGAAGTGFGDMSYTTSSTSGATTITLTLGTNPTAPLGFEWELACTATPCNFDVSNKVSDTTCTTCAMPSMVFTGTNDAVVALAGCGATCSGVTGTGWVNDFANPAGDGAGHVLNSITMGNFTQPSSTLFSMAIAFKETSGAGTVRHRAWVIQSQ